MRAARLHEYGAADLLRVEDVPVPALAPATVLVRIHAAGVNPIDWKTRAGQLRDKLPLELPATLGGDFSGVVEAVGPGAAFAIGDPVYGQASATNGGSGSFAELALAPASTIAPKPTRVDHARAAALPLAGVSALQALTEHLRVTRGQRILVHGGAGGIGALAIQIAKHLGAHVTTTASAKQREDASRAGADTVIDNEAQRFEEVVPDLDAVFDTVGGDTYVRSFQTLKPGGRLVSMLEPPRDDLMREFRVEAFAQVTRVTTERLLRLAELVDSGVIEARIARTFPLERAPAALAHLEKDSPRGKVMIVP